MISVSGSPLACQTMRAKDSSVIAGRGNSKEAENECPRVPGCVAVHESQSTKRKFRFHVHVPHLALSERKNASTRSSEDRQFMVQDLEEKIGENCASQQATCGHRLVLLEGEIFDQREEYSINE